MTVKGVTELEMPGFTGEVAIYKSRQNYRSSGSREVAFGDMSSVVVPSIWWWSSLGLPVHLTVNPGGRPYNPANPRGGLLTRCYLGCGEQYYDCSRLCPKQDPDCHQSCSQMNLECHAGCHFYGGDGTDPEWGAYPGLDHSPGQPI